MSETVIRFDNLSKRYKLGRRERYKTIRESMMSAATAPLRRLRRRGAPNGGPAGGDAIWALKDVSFEVRRGEVVGVIGSNGAGKSTLLKVLSRITRPTEGTVELVGRVGSLLEVGTGFHPELTGRENLFLNGAILGMPQSEVRRKFDEIVTFAEIERFIDTPVKHYSSGMYMRLAFAVAAHLEPEILVVDEVLAVGDVGFQRKCLRKMDEVAGEGRTVLFVSHSMGIIRQLCSRGILLDSGRLQTEGPIEQTVTAYEHALARSAQPDVWTNPEPDTGAHEAYLHGIRIESDSGRLTHEFSSSEAVLVHFDVTVHKESDILKVGFDLIRSGTIVFRAHQVDSLHPPGRLAVGRHRVSCRIPPFTLNLGEYYLTPQMSLHCFKGLTNYANPVLRFSVHLDTGVSTFHGVLDERNHPGVMFPLLDWTSARQGAAAADVARVPS